MSFLVGLLSEPLPVTAGVWDPLPVEATVWACLTVLVEESEQLEGCCVWAFGVSLNDDNEPDVRDTMVWELVTVGRAGGGPTDNLSSAARNGSAVTTLVRSLHSIHATYRLLEDLYVRDKIGGLGLASHIPPAARYAPVGHLGTLSPATPARHRTSCSQIWW